MTSKRKTTDSLHQKRLRQAKGQEPPPRSADVIDEEAQNTIVKYISAGNYVEIAATAAGISRSTVEHWLRRGRETMRLLAAQQREPDPHFKLPSAFESRCADFVQAVDQAIATAEVRFAFQVSKAGEHDWKASAWWLQHGPAKRRWHTIEATEVSGPGGAPVAVDHLTVLQQRLDRMAGQGPKTDDDRRAE